MKKYFVILFLIFSHATWSHDFLTEILFFSDEYGVNPYNVAVSYELTEAELLSALNIKKSEYQLNKLVKRSGSRNVRREYKNVGSTDCDFESDSLNKTCGVFDNFSGARSVAIDLCNGYAMAHVLDYPHGLVPQFTDPSTFTNGTAAAANHHNLYKYEHGLKFNCVEVVYKFNSLNESK